MAEGVERTAYDRHAVLAWICASGLTPKATGSWHIADFHPYLEPEIGGVALNKDGIGGLRPLAQGEMRVSARDVKVV